MKIPETMDKVPQYYVWFDMEYSTLDLTLARPLQVAAIITDISLKRVLPPESDVRLCIRLTPDVELSPWVEENLRELIEICTSDESVSIEFADTYLSRYVDCALGHRLQNKDERPILAGNSIHGDWWLACQFLPQFVSRLHYRHLDVTAFKLEWKRLYPHSEFEKENPEMIRSFFPEAVLPPAVRRHDAYYDLQASIAELAFYRKHLIRS